MNLLPVQIAILVTQQITAFEQPAASAPQVTETSDSPSLLLVTTQPVGSRWRRSIEELLLSKQLIAQTQGKESVDLAAIRAASRDSISRQKIALHPDHPVTFESDLSNSEPAVVVSGSVSEYAPGGGILPLPAFALSWPTVTPIFPPPNAEPNSAWKGKVTIEYGAGSFPVTYKATLLAPIEDDLHFRIEIDPEQSHALVDDTTLILKVQGHWEVRIDHKDGVWRSGRGELSCNVKAKYTEDGKSSELEIARWRNKFSLERVPIRFDQKHLDTRAWNPRAN